MKINKDRWNNIFFSNDGMKRFCKLIRQGAKANSYSIEYYKKNKERILIHNRIYRLTEQYKITSHLYYLKNIERIKKRTKEYYILNCNKIEFKEKRKKQNRNYYLNHKEQRNKYTNELQKKRYKEDSKYREYRKELQRKYRERKRKGIIK